VITPIEPADGVFFAIKCQERQFVVAWNGDAIIMFIIGILLWLLEIWDVGRRVGKQNLGYWYGLVWSFGVDDDRRGRLMRWNPAVARHAEGWVRRRWLWRTGVDNPAHGD
jgi:hypothetical protein